MDILPWNAAFDDLFTPQIADACLRLGIPVRHAPPGIRPLVAGSRVAGRVLPVVHQGSVDIFLECLQAAAGGDALVVDNQGRMDEACIGDLVALEARGAGISGIVVWGCHRDTAELIDIGLPAFTYGAWASGPERLDARPPDALVRARFGRHVASANDVVFGDDDGVLFLPGDKVDEVVATARDIRVRERRQASAIRAGRSLREQLRFAEYLAGRAADPSLTFRKHLRGIGGAIEE